ncbi:Plasmodium vivax Vir protein, putative [Plasmodium ovale]|uniref:Plasmodium vivax Vir protein, putative n=1 Tax=Plasmodium ovale TaxID=36330 RepID=A0A1C3KGE2_PLAOA|nr:Plasmodium vivax Vir protein, putative [Plasmodium ovale]
MKTNCDGETEMPSCKMYKILSTKNGNSDKFSEECDNIQGNLGYSGISDICKKLAVNLVYFCSNDDQNYPLDYNCDFINYWLFGEIFSNSSLTDDTMHTGTLSRFYTTWNNILSSSSCKGKCEPNKILFNRVIPQDLKFKKDMYDYIYNFDNFYKIDTASEQIDNKYCRYLEYMHTKYVHFKDSCQSSSNKCLHDAGEFEKYNPEKLCEKFQCKNESLCAKYFDEASTRGDPREAKLLENAEQLDDIDSESAMSEPNLETSSILTTVAPSLLGLFMTSFLIFKFKPIRSRLNNLIIKNKNIEEYMDEEANDEVLNNYFNLENRESETNGYGIAYHSA